MMQDWKIFIGNEKPHDRLSTLPAPPPWRFARADRAIAPASAEHVWSDPRAAAFLPTEQMIQAVNAALYLRRPLLLTGKPGTGKSSLILKVAEELQLGPVLKWPINSKSTVKSGIYDYDAVGRLHAGEGGAAKVEDFLTLGPLGTALMASGRPRALLVDEIDKSDLDFANDLLNVIEDGEYEIPELRRLREHEVRVREALGSSVVVESGRLGGGHFPFVIMTSNAEREFPPAFLRRCIRLTIEQPDAAQLAEIVDAQFQKSFTSKEQEAVREIIGDFLKRRGEGDLSTDQLLNTIFLTVAVKGGEDRAFTGRDIETLRNTLLSRLNEIGQ